MTINLDFAEIGEYVKKHYDKKLSFSRVSDKVLRVSYEQRILIAAVQVPVSITIEDVAADAIAISYNGGIGIDMIISGVLAFIKAKVPELATALVSEEGHRIRIELSRLSQTKALVEALALKDIQVLESELRISASLK